MLIRAHLRAPHPERPAQNNPMRAPSLFNFYPRAAQWGPRSVLPPRLPIESLSLVRVAVRILRKQNETWPNYCDRVAHFDGSSRMELRISSLEPRQGV